MTQYFGQQLTDAYVKKELLRKILYTQASLIAVGTKVSPEISVPVLDVKYNYPSEMTGDLNTG